MFTQRIAFACAFATCLLFSCNNKRNKNVSLTGSGKGLITSTTTVLLDGLLDINQYCEVFARNATQYFTVPAKKTTVVTATGGLRIRVTPGALETEDGSAVNGKINVKVIELTNSFDLFKSNAATMSNGRLLASGGSYYIDMESGGQKLRLKKGKAMQVDFPLLAKAKMELFYGERNNQNNMNWQPAGVGLKPQPAETVLFEYHGDANDFPLVKSNTIFGEHKTYLTLKEEVYYYNKKMTLAELVDTLNRYQPKVYIDTLYTWPKELKNLPVGARVDTNFLYSYYGPPRQFMLKTYKNLAGEKGELAKKEAARAAAVENWQPQSLAGQIQKYYMPSSITALGWINCDRLYRPLEQTDMEVELPITLNASHIEFFLLFRSVSGLMNLRADTSGPKKIFRNLPQGEPVILLGFTKANGQIYECREEFIIQKNKKLQLDFKDISPTEMAKKFGKNVRI
ncbi:MAG: hypothetical protein ABIO79_12460 [Ferruginibacter sp.]